MSEEERVQGSPFSQSFHRVAKVVVSNGSSLDYGTVTRKLSIIHRDYSGVLREYEITLFGVGDIPMKVTFE